MISKTLSLIVFGLALAALATTAVRADSADPTCLINFNGPAANMLTTGQTGQVIAVELR